MKAFIQDVRLVTLGIVRVMDYTKLHTLNITNSRKWVSKEKYTC